jgi:hypothetical protein
MVGISGNPGRIPGVTRPSALKDRRIRVICPMEYSGTWFAIPACFCMLMLIATGLGNVPIYPNTKSQ